MGMVCCLNILSLQIACACKAIVCTTSFIRFAVACGIPPSQSLIMNLQSDANDTHALAFWAAELEISSSDEISATHTCQVQDLEMESSSKPSTWGPIPDQWQKECQLSMQSPVG